MDFKSILNKLDSMEARVITPAAPELPKAVQLNEDAELRVLAGTSTYIAEAKKAKPDFLDMDKDGNKTEPMKKALKDKEQKTDEAFDADAKVGATKKTASGGTVTKTATGLVHKGKKYGGEEEKSDDDEDAPKAKKAKKESIDPEQFKAKFAKMVEAKTQQIDPEVKSNLHKAHKAQYDYQHTGSADAAKTAKHYAKKAKDAAAKQGREVYETESVADKKKGAVGKKVEEGKDEGKPGKMFAKIAKKAGEKYGSKAAGERVAGAVRKKVLAKESKMVAESVEPKLSFKDMVKLVQESGGQQQIDVKDEALFAWAQRVAAAKFTESTKQELYAGLVYERMGGVFEMYDVLSEDQK